MTIATKNAREVRQTFVLNYVPLALFTAFTTALVGSVFALHATRPMASGAAWALVLLMAFAGWGAIVNRSTVPMVRYPWGLRAALGMAATVVLGGVFCAFGAMSRGVGFGLVVVGLAALARESYRSRNETFRWYEKARRRVQVQGFGLLAFGLFAILAILAFLGSLLIRDAYNVNDDLIAYFAYPKMILQSGSLLDPFSVRRLGAYGGQSFLHAMVLLEAAPRQLFVLDEGICLFIAFVLVGEYGLRSRSRWSLLSLPALWLLVTLPTTRINSASAMSGVVLFFAMFRAAELDFPREASRTAAALVMVIPAIAACTLRQNYLAPVVMFFLAMYGLMLCQPATPPQGRKTVLREAALAAGLGLLLLAPWMVVSYRSSRTFLFPIFTGNYNKAYGSFGAGAGRFTINFLWENLCHNDPVKTLPFFVVAGLLYRDRSRRRALKSLGISAAAGLVAVAVGFPLSDTPNLARYYYAVVTAAALAASVATLHSVKGQRSRRQHNWLPAGIALIAIFLQLHEVRSSIHSTFGGYLAKIQRQFWAPLPADPLGGVYSSLQASVPAHSALLAMVDEPYRLDFGRNKIALLDLPGASSPPPGMPMFKGPEAMAAYWRSLGYQHVLFVEPASAHEIYRREPWESNAKNGATMWKVSAPYYLDMFDTLKALSLTRVHLAEQGGMMVLDLDKITTNAIPSP